MQVPGHSWMQCVGGEGKVMAYPWERPWLGGEWIGESRSCWFENVCMRPNTNNEPSLTYRPDDLFFSNFTFEYFHPPELGSLPCTPRFGQAQPFKHHVCCAVPVVDTALFGGEQTPFFPDNFVSLRPLGMYEVQRGLEAVWFKPHIRLTHLPEATPWADRGVTILIDFYGSEGFSHAILDNGFAIFMIQYLFFGKPSREVQIVTCAAVRLMLID